MPTSPVHHSPSINPLGKTVLADKTAHPTPPPRNIPDCLTAHLTPLPRDTPDYMNKYIPGSIPRAPTSRDTEPHTDPQ